MSKKPKRLANFEIPREQPARSDEQPSVGPAPTMLAAPAFLQSPESDGAVAPQPAPQPPPPPVIVQAEPSVHVPAPAPAQAVIPVTLSAPPVPQPIPRPIEEPRRQIGARVPLSLSERLRTYMFVSRESQQEAVEAALDAYLKEKGF